MGTIPASQLVSVIPSVLGAGGSGIDVIGLVLTNGTRVPLGTVASFPSGAAVTAYFGSGTPEDIVANGGDGKGSGYFGGFTNSNKKPAAILFAQYNDANVAAFLRGGDISALTLTQLQAISGSLSVVIDGVTKSGNPSLSAATSFSSAAVVLSDALDIEGAQTAAFTGSITGSTLTVTAVGSGALAVGNFVHGAGVTVGTYITALGTGTGGTGTYTVSASQTVGSEAMTTKTGGIVYDSVSGAFVITSPTTGAASTIAFATGSIADDLMLTSATGAVLSQGAVAAVPAAFMSALVVQNSNFVTFMTTFDPDGGSGNDVKQAFAAWKNSQNNRFCYVCWDFDTTPTTTLPATASLGYLLEQDGDSGTCLVWEPEDTDDDTVESMNLAAFVCGAAASIDFSQRNGRITFAYKAQDGLDAGVTDPTVAVNLAGNPQVAGSYGNGYNYYGAYAAANPPDFVWFQRGLVTGPFRWLDGFINQVWMNNAFQIALLNLMANSRSIPYGTDGNALIESALKDPIDAALNFGAFGPGVLSASQIAAVNAAAGANVAQTVQSQGYYLQILPASAAQRAGRVSPPCTFWYLDRGSVQAISLASVALT